MQRQLLASVLRDIEKRSTISNRSMQRSLVDTLLLTINFIYINTHPVPVKLLPFPTPLRPPPSQAQDCSNQTNAPLIEPLPCRLEFPGRALTLARHPPWVPAGTSSCGGAKALRFLKTIWHSLKRAAPSSAFCERRLVTRQRAAYSLRKANLPEPSTVSETVPKCFLRKHTHTHSNDHLVPKRAGKVVAISSRLCCDETAICSFGSGSVRFGALQFVAYARFTRFL